MRASPRNWRAAICCAGLNTVSSAALTSESVAPPKALRQYRYSPRMPATQRRIARRSRSRRQRYPRIEALLAKKERRTKCELMTEGAVNRVDEVRGRVHSRLHQDRRQPGQADVHAQSHQNDNQPAPCQNQRPSSHQSQTLAGWHLHCELRLKTLATAPPCHAAARSTGQGSIIRALQGKPVVQQKCRRQLPHAKPRGCFARRIQQQRIAQVQVVCVAQRLPPTLAKVDADYAQRITMSAPQRVQLPHLRAAWHAPCGPKVYHRNASRPGCQLKWLARPASPAAAIPGQLAEANAQMRRHPASQSKAK